jgi:CRP-like cAMP-binding protein
MSSRGKRATPIDGAADHWLSDGQVRTYRRGQTIISAGSPLAEWIAISGGAAFLAAPVAADTRVAVAALWLGDVIGADSPLGKLAARYDVTALVDVTTLHIPLTRVRDRDASQRSAETGELYAATASRLQDQITMRLAGNGLQRLVSVLATLATALTSTAPAGGATNSLALPVSQACIGQLSGLSRRQTWIYLGQLAERGWSRTARTKVTLDGLNAWLVLMAEVETRGLECIATLDQCDETLSRLAALK